MNKTLLRKKNRQGGIIVFLKFVIYTLFYLCVFLLGFFGVTPIFLLNSIEDKIPYIIVVIIGYSALIGIMVALYKKGFIVTGFMSKNKRLDREQLEEMGENIEAGNNGREEVRDGQDDMDE